MSNTTTISNTRATSPKKIIVIVSIVGIILVAGTGLEPVSLAAGTPSKPLVYQFRHPAVSQHLPDWVSDYIFAPAS